MWHHAYLFKSSKQKFVWGKKRGRERERKKRTYLLLYLG